MTSEETNYANMLVWRDDPAEADLLGFGIVATTVVDLVRDPSLDPVTVGVFSKWGGGKSTVLTLIEQALQDQPAILIIRVNPWQYDDFSDVRERLVGEILVGLPADDGDGRMVELTNLLARVRWSSVARTLGLAAAAGAVDFKALIESFTLKDAKGPEPLPDMSGFRDAFAKFIQSETRYERVVVLVDDLDRCLPDATVAVMEALKLFLAVPKMSFVLAVDHELIRKSIEASSQAGSRAQFAERYLEKIVQVPIHLPILSQSDAVDYVALLLMERTLSRESFDEVRASVEARRRSGEARALDPQFPVIADSKLLPMAKQLVSGLSADRWSTPRAIKRFLNSWGVRDRLASARGIQLDPAVSLKLLLLQEQHPADFQLLAETSPQDRMPLLKQWEDWAAAVPIPSPPGQAASAGKAVGTLTEKPAGVSDGSRAWAVAEPQIQGHANVSRYLTLAASIQGLFATASSLTDDELAAIDELTSPTESIRIAGTTRLSRMDEAGARKIGAALMERLAYEPVPTVLIEGLLHTVTHVPALAADAVGAIESVKTRLDAVDGLRLAHRAEQPIRELCDRLSSDPSVPEEARRAIAEERATV